MAASIVVIASLLAIVAILHDVFEVILLPRRVSRKFRLARQFYIYSWRSCRFMTLRVRSSKRREVFLSWFGPSSTLLLFALWAGGLIAAFATIHWAIGTPMDQADPRPRGLFDCVYFSGTTFTTLGFGDLTPIGPVGRFLAVTEAGLGFAYLAVVIGYLPVFYQAFSARELTISLLDARAGSPPTAASVLLRVAPSGDFAAIDRFLVDWERWSALVLESHLSFPLLSYYRSQHDNQSWLAALTAILDCSALVIAAVKGCSPYQAKLTFAMARHAVVDIAQVFRAPPDRSPPDRLGPGGLTALLGELRGAGLGVRDEAVVEAKLDELRALYEPFLLALSAYFLLPLPPIRPRATVVDNWQTSAWMKRSRGLASLHVAGPGDDHDD